MQMQTKRDRAWRRKQNKKSINKAFKVFKYNSYWSCDYSDKDFKLMAKINHNNMTTCSNPNCCGNPRKKKGRNVLTRNEILNVIDFKSYKKED